MGGYVYDTPLSLPGAANSRLRHHAFSVASEEYIAANRATILISSTTGSTYQVRPPYAFFIADPALYRHEQDRRFDISRPITPTLLAVMPESRLTRRVGRVGEGFFTGVGCQYEFGAHDALRVQLQLPGRMNALRKLFSKPRDVAKEALGKQVSVERLSIWTLRDAPGLWVVVSNDKNNCTTGFVLGLEIRESPAPFPQTALQPADHTMARTLFLGAALRVLRLSRERSAAAGTLNERVGNVRPSGAAKTDSHLQVALGLPANDLEQ
jgi:hypothetical protein